MIFQYIDILRYSLSQYGIDTIRLVISMHAKVKVYFILHFLLFPQTTSCLIGMENGGVHNCRPCVITSGGCQKTRFEEIPLDVWSNISVT